MTRVRWYEEDDFPEEDVLAVFKYLSIPQLRYTDVAINVIVYFEDLSELVLSSAELRNVPRYVELGNFAMTESCRVLLSHLRSKYYEDARVTSTFTGLSATTLISNSEEHKIGLLISEDIELRPGYTSAPAKFVYFPWDREITLSTEGIENAGNNN